MEHQAGTLDINRRQYFHNHPLPSFAKEGFHIAQPLAATKPKHGVPASHRLKWFPTKDTPLVGGERRGAHADAVIGALCGFDRLVFRGTLRMLAHHTGMNGYLWRVRVLLKDFASHAEALTRHLRGGSEELAKRTARPIR
jgi:hypothetical protein